MSTIAASAVGTLMSQGYTEAEAKRIRSFLPRRFELIGYPLPATNIEAWLAYRAVKHYLLCANERGSFKPHSHSGGCLNMQPRETMAYVTKTETLVFRTIEFVRHFGDALFTDVENGVTRIVRMNSDDSFVIKNRRLVQLLREMEQRATNPQRPNSGTNPYQNSRMSDLYLPVEETYSPSDIFEMYLHGGIAKEYTVGLNLQKNMIGGVNFHIVAKYLYFLYSEKRNGMPHGSNFDSERMAITLLMTSCGGETYASFPSRSGNAIYFGGFNALTTHGMLHVELMPRITHTAPDGYYADDSIVRFSLNGHMETSPHIPRSVREYYTDAEWSTALTG